MVLLLCLGVSGQAAGSRVKAALGCLMSQRQVQAALQQIGLRPGQTAWVRFYVGSIPGAGATPGEYYLAVYAADRKRGWLLLADPDPSGRFEAVDNAYRLRKVGRHWRADEGDGGAGLYRVMGQFADWLERHRRRFPVKLTPRAAACAPAPR